MAAPASLEDRAAPASLEFDPTDYGPEWAMSDKIRGDPTVAKHIKMEPWGISTVPKCWHMYHLGNFGDAVAHCTKVIRELLARPYVKEFRIGITSDPIVRFFNKPSIKSIENVAPYWMRGYILDGFTEMRVLVSSDASGVVGPIEIELLKKYRFVHHLCGNKRRGGEGADFGKGPYYVYVVFKFNPGAPELRSSDRTHLKRRKK